MEITQIYEEKKIIKKIFHISDIHIRTGNKSYSRYLEYLDIIKKLIIELKHYTYENTIVIITGDLFHHKNIIEAHGIDIFNKLITDLTNLTSVYLIRGNHDYRQDNEINDIDLISALIQNSNYNNLYYLNKTGLYEVGDILIGLVAIQDTLKSGDTSGYVTNLPIFPWTDNKKYKHTVALYHGIIVENDKTIYKHSINIDWVKKYNFGLFGDIHRQHIYNSKWNNDGYYEIDDKDKIMWGYSGSLVQQTFGEPINKHGFLLWDLDNYRVKSVDISNKHVYCNLINKDNLWYTKIIDNKFNDKNIEFENFLIKNPYINKISIQVKNNIDEHDNINEILKSNNVNCIRISNKIINNDNNCKYDSEESEYNNIKEYNSIESCYEFVNNNINDDNKDILNNFNWKNIIKNPDSLLIKTDNIPNSILEKVNDKNDSLSKNISKYISARDEVLNSNTLELKYMNWDWILCYKNDCYFNFENMEKNVMLLNANNGCGKSSFLEIICLGLFGSSIPSRANKQFSSSIICNKKPKSHSSKIKLVFKLNDKEYMLIRNFNKKSNDNNKLEQKTYLYFINKTGDNDNLVFINSGTTAVNSWITNNIGSPKTFFQSCMHTQNSDFDLFSMPFKDQKNLMDESLSLQSINILIEIFKKTMASYTTIMSHISTLDNEIKNKHIIVDKEELDILKNECKKFNNDIIEIENEINSNKFPSEVNDIDIELDEFIINEKIEALKKLTENNKIEDISETIKYSGELLSVIKQYKSFFKYYDIDYENNISTNIDSNKSFISKNISCELNNICDKVLSTNIPKIKDINKENKLIENYFNNFNFDDKDVNIDYKDVNIDEKDNLEELRKNKKNRYEILNKEIQINLITTNNILINYQKEELLKNKEKIEKMEKNYSKRKNHLDKNNKCLIFFETNSNIIKENDKDILYIRQQISNITENEYPFNPNCDCCLKQPWKIQLSDLEKNLMEKENENCKIKEDIKNKENEINISYEDIQQNIVKLDKWFANYEEIKKNEDKYNKQLKLIIKKEQLYKEYEIKNNENKKINEELYIIDKKLEKINEKIVYEQWIKRKEQNIKNKQDYDLSIKEKIEEWNMIQDYKNYFNNLIKENDVNTKNINLLKYWIMIKELKPKWEKIKIQKTSLKNKRNYLQNIRTKYLSLKNSYNIYLEECNKMKNYKDIYKNLKNKLDGVEILSKMFNNYRIWLYKEKLFPLILNKINIIIGNMSKNDELLKLDIVWTDDIFNWFIIHNDNKIVINKASGYQKFIIDLSMRITLSSIGISSLKCNQLFIDEGFSTCDQEHLNKIPLFLNSLLNIYNYILVVSHIQEIKNCTSSSYDIKREENLSLINYGNDKNKILDTMIKDLK